MQVIVLGGGIAGLASSILLADQGKSVTLLEKNNLRQEQGAGIQITPNALRVIEHLGILDSFKQASDIPKSINIREIKSLKKLLSIPLQEYSDSVFKGTYHHIHRQDFIELLSTRATELGVDIYDNERIIHIEEAKNRVSLHSESQKMYEADILIAADGLNSVARKHLFPEYHPTFMKFSAWRTCIQIDGSTPDVFKEPNLLISKDLHLVTYPIRHDSFINCVLISKDMEKKKESWKESASLSEVMPLIDNTNTLVKTIFQQSRGINKWGLFEHSLPKWYSKKIVLIGDAAHPMMPFMAQGGCAALEDSYALSTLLKESNDINSSFANFQNTRYARVRKIQNMSLMNRHAYHQPLLLRRLIFMILHILPFILLSRLKSIYNYDIVSSVNK